MQKEFKMHLINGKITNNTNNTMSKAIDRAKLYLMNDDKFMNAILALRDKGCELMYNTSKNRKIIDDYAHEILSEHIDYDNFVVESIGCSDKSNTPEIIDNNTLLLDVNIRMKPSMKIRELKYSVR